MQTKMLNAFSKKPYGFYGLQPHLPLKSVAKMPLQASIFARIIMYADENAERIFKKAIRLLRLAAASAIEIGRKNALASEHFCSDCIVRKHMCGFKKRLWRKKQ